MNEKEISVYIGKDRKVLVLPWFNGTTSVIPDIFKFMQVVENLIIDGLDKDGIQEVLANIFTSIKCEEEMYKHYSEYSRGEMSVSEFVGSIYDTARKYFPTMSAAEVERLVQAHFRISITH